MSAKKQISLTILLRKGQNIAEFLTITIIGLGGLYADKYYPGVFNQIEFVFIITSILLILLLWKIKLKQDLINLFRFAGLFIFSFSIMFIVFNITSGISPSADPMPHDSLESVGYFFFGSYIWVIVYFPFLRLISLLENKTIVSRIAYILPVLTLFISIIIHNSLIIFFGYTLSLLIANFLQLQEWKIR